MFKRTLTNNNFNDWAEMVAAPADPYEYSPAAMERAMEYLSPYIVDVKGVHFKFHSRNKIELIHFQTKEERAAYETAWENYLKACALIENSDSGNSKFMLLVQFLKFRQAAELIRAPYLAKRCYEIVNNKNRSAVVAVNFKETISKIVSILVLDYGVSREEISLIWGGQKEKGKKKRVSKEQEEQLLSLFVSEEDKELLEELGIGGAKDREDSEEEEDATPSNNNRELLKLGNQSRKVRQIEIDKFQRDESKYCLFTFKSGGVGLSLHQELPTRRTRESLIAPTYSAIELVQGLGRAHRITSESDTEQTIVFYANTIEVHVALRVSSKLKCLKKVVRQKESWEDVIYGQKREVVEEVKQLPEEVGIETDDNIDEALSGGSEEDESEEEENNE